MGITTAILRVSKHRKSMRMLLAELSSDITNLN